MMYLTILNQIIQQSDDADLDLIIRLVSEEKQARLTSREESTNGLVLASNQ